MKRILGHISVRSHHISPHKQSVQLQLQLQLHHKCNSTNFKYLYITNRPKLMELGTKQKQSSMTLFLTLQNASRCTNQVECAKLKNELKHKFEYDWSLVYISFVCISVRYLPTWLTWLVDMDMNVFLVGQI